MLELMETGSHPKRHERDLRALQAIAIILSAPMGQKEMLQEILEVLDDELGLRGAVLLLAADGRDLIVEAMRLPRAVEPAGPLSQRGAGLTGRVVESGQPVVIARVSQELASRSRSTQSPAGDEGAELSFICVPVVLGNEVLGALSVDLPFEEPPALLAVQRLLTLVASLIANDVKARRLARRERRQLEAENQRLRGIVEGCHRPENIIGNSKAMRALYTRLGQVTQTDTTVLLRGESGTGKELVAATLHYSSPRAAAPFIKVNCAAFNESQLDSELFGHEKGAVPGAFYTRSGRFEEAEGGTLFLDGIGDFPPPLQIKLLRVLQEHEYERAGDHCPRKSNVRIIAATHRDLEWAVQAGAFRQDLYYRINVFPLHLPALRDRRDDILLLANHFVAKAARRLDKPVRRIATTATDLLLAYHWPGNVRELENCIEHAVLLSTDGAIYGHHLPPTLQFPDRAELSGNGTLKANVQVLERDMIVDTLKRANGSIALAAEELGITARMVRYKIKSLGIDYVLLFKQRRRRRDA